MCRRYRSSRRALTSGPTGVRRQGRRLSAPAMHRRCDPAHGGGTSGPALTMTGSAAAVFLHVEKLAGAQVRARLPRVLSAAGLAAICAAARLGARPQRVQEPMKKNTSRTAKSGAWHSDPLGRCQGWAYCAGGPDGHAVDENISPTRTLALPRYRSDGSNSVTEVIARVMATYSRRRSSAMFPVRGN